MEHKITITFDEKNGKHNLKVRQCTGREIIIAYQSLQEAIEEKTGLPINIVINEAYKIQGNNNDTNN